MRRAVAMAMVLGALSGCQEEACVVPTADLSMVADVTENAGTVRARVDFAWGTRGDDPRPWSRCDGDSVRINGREATETVRDDRVDYSLTLDAQTAPRDFRFSLDRERDDAPVESSIALPVPFEIVRPAPGEQVSRGSEYALQWAPAAPDALMAIQLIEEIGGGICLTTDMPDHDYKGALALPDTGEWLIPANALASDGDDCDASILMARFSFGDYPEALADGGLIEALVVRSISFVSVP